MKTTCVLLTLLVSFCSFAWDCEDIENYPDFSYNDVIVTANIGVRAFDWNFTS